MRRGIIGGLALTLMGSTAAYAADLYQPKYNAIQPPSYIWTGFSVGAGIGASMMDTDISGNGSRRDTLGECEENVVDPPGGGAPPQPPFILDAECEAGTFDPAISLLQGQSFDLNGLSEVGFLGTLQIALDYQFAEQWVVGLFADVDWHSLEASYNSASSASLAFPGAGGGPGSINLLSANANANINVDWGFTLGGRLGYLMTPRTMIYGLAGYSQVNLDNPSVQVSFSDPVSNIAGSLPGPVAGALAAAANSPSSMTLPLPDSLDGYTLGAGVEVMISEAWSVKTEYRYSSFDGGDISLADSRQQCCVFTGGPDEIARSISDQSDAHFDMDIHSVRVLVTRKFGSPLN